MRAQDGPGRFWFWSDPPPALMALTCSVPAAPSCSFLLLVLKERLQDLQVALLASILDLDQYQQNRCTPCPIPRAQGLLMIRRCPPPLDRRLLLLLGCPAVRFPWKRFRVTQVLEQVRRFCCSNTVEPEPSRRVSDRPEP